MNHDFVLHIRDEGFSAITLLSTITASNKQAISLSMKHESMFGTNDVVLNEIPDQSDINIDISVKAKRNPSEINLSLSAT